MNFNEVIKQLVQIGEVQFLASEDPSRIYCQLALYPELHRQNGYKDIIAIRNNADDALIAVYDAAVNREFIKVMSERSEKP